MYCRDPLWDLNVTWYTTNPDFTTCFQQTVLVFVPVGVLALGSLAELYYAYASKDRLVPWTVLNGAKTALCAGLILLSLVDLIYVCNL